MKPLDPRLLRYARTTRIFLLSSVALGTATAALIIAQATLLAGMLTRAFLGGATLSGLRTPMLLLLAVVAGRALVAWLQEVAAHRSSAAVKSQLRGRLLAHAMALGYDGTVWTWGASEFGERGNKEKGFERVARQTESWFEARDKPIRVPGLSGVKQIAAGGKRDYALLSDGQVMAWGEDRDGDLGVEENGSEEELCLGEVHAITPVQCSTIPRAVKVKNLGKLSGVERIAAGEETAYAIGSGGKKVAAAEAGLEVGTILGA